MGWGREEQMHNVDNDPVKTVGWGVNRESRERAREREEMLHHKSQDGTDTSSVM